MVGGLGGSMIVAGSAWIGRGLFGTGGGAGLGDCTARDTAVHRGLQDGAHGGNGEDSSDLASGLVSRRGAGASSEGIEGTVRTASNGEAEGCRD